LDLCSEVKKDHCLTYSFGNSPTEYIPMNLESLVPRGKYSFWIDLRQPLEVLWKHLKESHRRKIRKATKQGVRIRIYQDDGLMDMAGRLTDILNYTVVKHSEAGKSRQTVMKTFVENIIHHLVLKGYGLVFVAYMEDRPVSFAVITTFDQKATYVYGASNFEGYEANAPAKLMWEAIEYFRSRKFALFSLGEVPQSGENESDIDHGLYRFKSGFGGERKVLCSGTIILRPRMYEIFSALSGVKRIFRG
jgi:lipid II:glycine glycyltransferase (peptidoglycan interpeptide bridge formation enzyme)